MIDPLTLPIGRELDILVAQKVMGCHVKRGGSEVVICGCEAGTHNDQRNDELLRYSTDNTAADTVVARLYQDGWYVRVRRAPDGLDLLLGDGFRSVQDVAHLERTYCSLFRNAVPLRMGQRSWYTAGAEGDSALHAVCLAALTVIGTP